jgi:UDP-glucose 4-epimerase
VAATKVVVTGGAGFIGANLCKLLCEAGGIDEVLAFDNLATGSRQNLLGPDGTPVVELREATILDPAALDEAFVGATAVVHLAARPSVPKSVADPVASHDANVNGTVQVLEAIRRAGNPQLIVASSSSVYGGNPTLPKSEDLATLPLSPYAASKLATEAYTLAYGHSFGIDALAFRFFNVFGPLQAAGHAYAAVVPAFIDAAMAGRPLPVHGDGLQTRDFTYVGTVAAVINDAIRRRVSYPGPVNLAFGSRYSLLDLIDLLGKELGRELEVEHTQPRTGDVRDSQADQSRLRSLFPDVEPVDLPTGLHHTVEWFKTLGPGGA